MSCHRCNYLAEQLYGELSAKIGQGILSCYLINKECSCYLPSKVNGKCVYEGKSRRIFLIYELKCSLFGAIYKGNTYKTFKKIMDGHFSNLLRLLKNGQKSDSFAAYLKKHFKSTMICPDFRKCMTFKVVKQLNPIDEMK